MTFRRVDTAIIDVTRNQRCHRLPVDSVDQERNDRQVGGMKLLQEEIEVGTANVKLA